ncbi:MAG: hypothetical protein GQ474_09785 [Sulfurimonas sp.]|nr:hypothetical protein [Sulfurimonas sp.]
MCQTENKWFYNKLNEVDQDSQNAILHFSLLWSLFESKFCNEYASATSIHRKCEELGETLDVNHFNAFLIYFKDRYITNNSTNEKFNKLNFRGNDKRELVERVLKSETTNIIETISALLIIVYRLRNNLFHGLKWQYNIQGQYSNFDISNQLLIKALETVDI